MALPPPLDIGCGLAVADEEDVGVPVTAARVFEMGTVVVPHELWPLGVDREGGHTGVHHELERCRPCRAEDSRSERQQGEPVAHHDCGAVLSEAGAKIIEGLTKPRGNVGHALPAPQRDVLAAHQRLHLIGKARSDLVVAKALPLADVRLSPAGVILEVVAGPGNGASRTTEIRRHDDVGCDLREALRKTRDLHAPTVAERGVRGSLPPMLDVGDRLCVANEGDVSRHEIRDWAASADQLLG